MNRGRGERGRGGANKDADVQALEMELRQERSRREALERQLERTADSADAAKAALPKPPTTKEKKAARDTAAAEKFHSLHTFLLAPANMAAQMMCAAIFIHPGPLLRDPAYAEGVRFFVYALWGYTLPAVWFAVFHAGMLSKSVKYAGAWIAISIIGVGALLAYFDR